MVPSDEDLRRAEAFQSSLGGKSFDAWRSERFEWELVQFLYSHYRIPSSVRADFSRWCRERERSPPTLHAWSAYFQSYPAFFVGRSCKKCTRAISVPSLFVAFERLAERLDFQHLRDVYIGDARGRIFVCVVPCGRLGSGRALVVHDGPWFRESSHSSRLLGRSGNEELVMETFRDFIEWLDVTHDLQRRCEWIPI